MSESSEQARVEWEPLSVREARRRIAEWETRGGEALANEFEAAQALAEPTRATATDEQRARVRQHAADLEYAGRLRHSRAFAAVLADSEALAARVGEESDWRTIPLGLFAGANRYRTDLQDVLSLWRDDGGTTDLYGELLRCPTCDAAVMGEPNGTCPDHFHDGFPAPTLGAIVDDLISAIDNGEHPAEDARLVVNELTRWWLWKYPDPEPAPTHEREEK